MRKLLTGAAALLLVAGTAVIVAPLAHAGMSTSAHVDADSAGPVMISVPTVDDGDDEPDQTLTVTISLPADARRASRSTRPRRPPR